MIYPRYIEKKLFKLYLYIIAKNIKFVSFKNLLKRTHKNKINEFYDN